MWMPLIAIPAAAVAALCTLALLDQGAYWFLAGAPLAIGATILCAIYLCDRCIVEWAITSRCATCNYDLRGNTTGVCPECGEAVHA